MDEKQDLNKRTHLPNWLNASSLQINMCVAGIKAERWFHLLDLEKSFQKEEHMKIFLSVIKEDGKMSNWTRY